MPELAAHAARMAGRIADLLEALAPPLRTELADAAGFLRRQAAERPPESSGPFERLAGALQLTALERELVVLAALPDEHEGYAGVLRRITATGEPRPTVGLAAQLLAPGAAERADLHRALAGGRAVRHGLLVLGGDGPIPDRTLALPPDLWRPPPALAAATAGLGAWLEQPDTRRASAALAQDVRCTLLVIADDVATARGRALALAAAAGRRAVDDQPLRALAHDAVALLEREAPPGDHPGPAIVAAAPGDPIPSQDRPLLVLRVEPLPVAAREALWGAVLPELAAHAPALATRHPVEPAVATRAALDARAAAALDGRGVTPHDIAHALRARSAGALPAGAMLRRPTAGWEQLVLPPDRLAQLHAAADRLRHQRTVLDDWGFLAGRPGARGVRVLLSGPPGTGKTLAAEVLARAVERDLLIVDLSSILSKWIGETEQRLAEVFAAAERAQAVVLFDEADALFAKRTAVSDAHDRYANLETAYLLQRLERFEGLAVLATNLRHNIDPAFTRRLELVIELDEPGPLEREALWLAHVPEAAPLAPDLDVAALAARYPVVGGVIRNAAVAAAFLAAAEGAPIGAVHAITALEREYDKHGRAFPGRPATVALQEEPWPR